MGWRADGQGSMWDSLRVDLSSDGERGREAGGAQMEARPAGRGEDDGRRLSTNRVMVGRMKRSGYINEDL